jgi:hypothetical protein
VGGWVDLSSGPAGTTLILSVPLHLEAAGGGMSFAADTDAGADADAHAKPDAEAEAWSTRY